MPKGQQRKIKGAICNVPVLYEQTCKILPPPSLISGTNFVKVEKDSRIFRGHVLNALNWLKNNNPLYKNITM